MSIVNLTVRIRRDAVKPLKYFIDQCKLDSEDRYVFLSIPGELGCAIDETALPMLEELVAKIKSHCLASEVD